MAKRLRTDRVDVVVPVFNKLELLQNAVASAKQYGGDKLGKFFFVDDCSTEPGIAEFCRQEGDYFRNNSNRGFARSCNIGVKRSESSRVVILNTDTQACEGWLEGLLQHMKADIAVMGPLLIFPENSILPGRPAGKVQSCGFAINVTGLPYHRFIGWSPTHPKVNIFRDDLQGITGAVWLIDKQIWQYLNGFDETFISYFEDADYCQRAVQAGYKIAYSPDSVLYHAVGGSADGRDQGMVFKAQHYMRKHAGKILYDEWKLL